MTKFFLIGLMLAGSTAFAHGKACKQFWSECKGDKANMKQCITDKATAAGDAGKACLDDMAKHEKGHAHGNGSGAGSDGGAQD